MSFAPLEPAGPIPLMKVLTCALADAGATRALGEAIGRAAADGVIVLLSGDVGAGKTTLAQGILTVWTGEMWAESPTFTLVATYGEDVHHVDLYRLSEAEAADIGLEEILSEGGRVIVEWWERAASLMPDDRLQVSLEPAGEGRRAKLVASGARHEAILRAVAARWEGAWET